MRYTENRHGKTVIPKRFYDSAVEKLARYEDTGLTPEQICQIDRLFSEKRAELGKVLEKSSRSKVQLLLFLDEIDGQIIDDPVAEIREKVEEIL